MDHSLEHHKSYIGKPASALPTPSLLISLPIVKRNIDRLHADVEQLGLAFRSHVKTLKTADITRLMTGNGKYKAIAASTLAELRGLLPLVDEGLINECLYALPICRSYLPQLAEIRKRVRVLLMIDNEQQVRILEEFGAADAWDVFIKLDVGSRRAGVAPSSPALRSLVARVEASSAANIYGFYCHAGHSYAGRTAEDAEETLRVEVSSVLGAAALLPADRPLVVSVGATPTAHIVRRLQASVPDNVKLELHAGNFPCNDLQQVSTSLVAEADQAARVATEVCGVYPERNEALVNAGAIALSRETSGYPGFGRVAGCAPWNVVRLSQEHGILATTDADSRVDSHFKVGDRVYLWCNHVCITAAAFFVYYIVDENDVVVDTWIPWKGW